MLLLLRWCAFNFTIEMLTIYFRTGVKMDTKYVLLEKIDNYITLKNIS